MNQRKRNNNYLVPTYFSRAYIFLAALSPTRGFKKIINTIGDVSGQLADPSPSFAECPKK